MAHAVWKCKMTKWVWLVWFPSLNDFLGACREENEAGQVWEGIASILSNEELERVAIAMWVIWNFRSKTSLSSEKSDIKKLDR